LTGARERGSRGHKGAPIRGPLPGCSGHWQASGGPSWQLRGGGQKSSAAPGLGPLTVHFGDFFFYRTEFRQRVLRGGQRCALRLAMPRAVPWPRQMPDMRSIGQSAANRRRFLPRCRIAVFSGLFSLAGNDATGRHVMLGNMGTLGTYIKAGPNSGLSVAKSCSQPCRWQTGTLGTFSKVRGQKNRAPLLLPSGLPGAGQRWGR
jgi:hypothetical protein